MWEGGMYKFMSKVNGHKSTLCSPFWLSFAYLVEKGIIIENTFMDKGELKMANKNTSNQSIPNGKKKFGPKIRMMQRTYMQDL